MDRKEVKTKPCPICGDTNFKKWSTTQRVCGAIVCALEWNRQKDRQKTAKKARADLVAFKGNDLSWQHKQTQKSFNKLRKLQEFKWFSDRGLEPVCISCGGKNMDWCCGHYKTVGSQGSLRYDYDNTKLQCNRYCNKGLSGNINGNRTSRGYLIGLHDRFGKEEAERIILYCSKDNVKKWTCEELGEMRKLFNREIRELESI